MPNLFSLNRSLHKQMSLNSFQHTTNLQQTTENIPILMKVQSLNKVENMVTKGEIACFEQFLLLSPCFQKSVCCRGIRNAGLVKGRPYHLGVLIRK